MNMGYMLMTLYAYVNVIVGYKLAQDHCCYFETNSTESTCTVNITAPPSSMVEVLVLELMPTGCNFVSNQSQLSVFVEHFAAGV